MTVIDVHTHMLTLEWIDRLRQYGGGRYEVKKTKAGQDSIFLDNVPFMTLMPGMWDYDLRIKAMDAAGVDVAIVSLTCPNVFWGDRTTSLAAAQQVNDSMAENLDDGRLFTEIGREFHDLIVRGCGNQTIIAVVGTLETLWTSHERQWADESAASGTYPSLAKRRAVLSTHIKLAETIAEGDIDRARRIAGRHLADTQTYVLSGRPDQRIHALSPQAMSRPRDLRRS